MGVPQSGWLLMDNPIKMDDLGVAPSMETPWNPHMCQTECQFPEKARFLFQ